MNTYLFIYMTMLHGGLNVKDFLANEPNKEIILESIEFSWGIPKLCPSDWGTHWTTGQLYCYTSSKH